MIVAWEQDQGDTPDIFAQRLSAAGVLQWSSYGVTVCYAPHWQN